MSLFVASLNSGSNGNCYYVGNEHEAVLIDAGISCRETETRMARLGLSMRKVKAIFVSHEHSDHIRGVTVLAKKYKLPVYITPLTMHHGGLRLDDNLVTTFFADQPIHIGELLITAFSKLHDAAHPHSFTIACGDVKVGVFTDLGVVCENLILHFQQCHAAFLEANYDEGMLESGNYPFHLKRRIRGGNGHLSNRQALTLFIDYKPAHMSHLFLSHLSKDNNDPILVHNLFNTHARGAEIVIASRYVETPVYHISGTGNPANAAIASLQFSLF
ncbi:MBL fold metallo-hydrolase [Mucilaginibacter sp.]|uniref:MBL fold metallo-hydrolase n=1 Tax=Mucilaginibacter sp. TaxID=1882438 RepID=UPI00262345FB|nr:MBL fold metallo-hydrolase [Mucilaginibacter sp.]MDB4925899.1 Phosphoribosyl 1,2-cyclic phosphodiesterase [Mucilaginibacter sp.]